MGSSSRKRRRRKALLAAEIIILVVLSTALFAAIWITQKLSLVNYDSEFDRSKVKTSTEAKQERKTASANTTQSQSQSSSANTQEQTSQTESTAQTRNDSGLLPHETYEPQGEISIPEQDFSGIDMIALVGLDTRPLEEDEDTGDNSDTMIIACINHNDKTIKLVSIYRDTFLNIGEDYDGTPDTYTKANAAYNIGGPEQFLSMINLNLDLDVTEYITVEFKALATAIEILGGIDVDLTYQEIVHLNNYNIETSAACDMDYVEIELPPIEEFYGAMTRTYHLNGSQAVSYARIRYTDGFDFRRASRQRLVLSLLKEKAKNADLATLNTLLNAVLPLVTTNLDSSKIFSMAWPVLSYTMTDEDQSGFPFVHLEDEKKTGIDCVIPITLEYNVQKLHEMLFPDQEYYPSDIVLEYSEYITELTGYGEETIEPASEIPDDAAIPQYYTGDDAGGNQGEEDEYSDEYYEEDGYTQGGNPEEQQYGEDGYNQDGYSQDGDGENGNPDTSGRPAQDENHYD